MDNADTCIFDPSNWFGLICAVNPSNYEALFQLAVGLNLVLGGYAEQRRVLEDETTEMIKGIEQDLKAIIAKRTAEVTAQPCRRTQQLLERAKTRQTITKELKEKFGKHLVRLRRTDRQILFALLAMAALATLSLFLTAFFKPTASLPNGALMIWAVILHAPVIIAVWRAVIGRELVYKDYRRQAGISRSATTTMLNTDAEVEDPLEAVGAQ